MARWLVPVFGVVFFAGCVDTSPDRVKLVATIENPDLSIEEATLITILAGDFDLVLTLGDLASESRTVERPPSISLVRAEDRSFVRNIDAVPAGDGFPVTIAAGEAKTLSLTLTEENMLPAGEFETVCGAGELVLAGGLEEADGTDVPFESDGFLLEGCP
jgi:hypothetical protein